MTLSRKEKVKCYKLSLSAWEHISVFTSWGRFRLTSKAGKDWLIAIIDSNYLSLFKLFGFSRSNIMTCN